AAIEATDERDAQDKALLLWNSDDRAVHFTDHSFVDIEVKPVPKRFRVHYWIKQVCSIEIEAETANEAEFIVERRLDDTGDVLPDSAIT
ncbi:hypothetical protein ABTM73_19010, partial [Acinetobacter baumannii]